MVSVRSGQRLGKIKALNWPQIQQNFDFESDSEDFWKTILFGIFFERTALNSCFKGICEIDAEGHALDINGKKILAGGVPVTEAMSPGQIRRLAASEADFESIMGRLHISIKNFSYE